MSTQTNKVGINSWRFSGTVERKSFKFSQKGNAYVSLMVKIPAKNDKFTTTMWIKCFKELAEQINDQVESGTTWDFRGYVSNSSYEKDGQRVFSNDFIVTRFAPAEADDEEQPVQEAVTESAPSQDDGVPF